MSKNLKEERGMTLVESLIAMLILLVALLAMAQVLAFSVIASKNYGQDAGKTTVSARDKMEELTGMGFTYTFTNPSDTFTDTRLTAGGSLYPSTPVTGYADYFDTVGGTAAASDAVYVRQWQISDISANQKRIMVSVSSTDNRRLRYGERPSTTLVTVKTRTPQ